MTMQRAINLIILTAFTVIVIALADNYLKNYFFTIHKLSDFSESISALEPVSNLTLKTNQNMSLPVMIVNTGHQIWIGDKKDNFENKPYVRLSYHWLNINNNPIIEGIRTPLLNNVKSGKSLALNANIQTPSKPGKYILSISMLQEGVAWFVGPTAKPLNIPVNVVG